MSDEAKYQPGDYVLDGRHGCVEIHSVPGMDVYDRESFFNSEEGYTFHTENHPRGYWWAKQSDIIKRLTKEEYEKIQLMEALK